MAVHYNSAEPLFPDLPSLSILDAVNRIREDGDERTAGCLESIQNYLDSLSATLSDFSISRDEEIIVTSADTGETIARIGSFPAGDEMLSGLATLRLWVGGDVDDPVNTAPFFTDGAFVVIGENGRVFVRNTRGEDKGFIGVEVEADQPIVGAANNGSGLIRLTVTGHGYESGDTVDVSAVGGVPNASGSWPVTVVTANTFDLIGSTFAGAYTSGGTVYRYFGGVWSETFAAGNTGFGDALFRVFADSSLRIGTAGGARLEVSAAGALALVDAGLTITSGTKTITIDASDGIKVLDTATQQYVQILNGSVVVNSTARADQFCTVSSNFVEFQYGTGKAKISASATNDDGAKLLMYDQSGVQKVLIQADNVAPTNNKADVPSLNVGGTQVINSSRDGFFNTITVNGTLFDPSLYYTAAQVDALLADKANAAHSHNTISISGTAGTVAHTHSGVVS